MNRTTPFLALLLVMAATPALAHTGVGAVHGLEHGFLHPLTGPDHLLAMLAVGLWSGQQSGKSVWLWPAAFVGAMILGGLLGLAGVEMPGMEAMILGSVIVLGALTLFGVVLPRWAGAAIVAAFAVSHGMAHGLEMPADGGGAAYFAGFAVATALLHAAGIGIALAGTRNGRPILARASGGVCCAAGLLLAVL
ncbi:MAG: HupE/UreJ family protein [Oceanibaculum sp.]